MKINTTDDVAKLQEFLDNLILWAKENPKEAFEMILRGGMINEDGSLKEELFN